MGKLRARLRPLYLPFLILGLLVFLEMAWLSIARYQGYNTSSFDLGAMSQAIWSATQGLPLVFTSGGVVVSRLANHVELIFFLLAPLYSLWPSPVLLLIIQTVLFVAGAFPLFVLANRRLASEKMAWVVTAVYLFYPVAQTAVLFQFHGDTLAMPLLIFVIEALDRHAWSHYFFWLCLALTCKFYVAVPLMALGGLVWWQGNRQIGSLTFVISLVWGTAAFTLLRPFFALELAQQTHSTPISYFNFYFGQSNLIWVDAPLRLINGVFIFTPVVLLGRRVAGWIVVATVVVLPVLLSSGPGPVYSYRFHHYALAVPFLMAAIVYGAEQLRLQQMNYTIWPPQELFWQYGLILTLFITLLLNSLTVNTPLNLWFYFPRDGFAEGWSETGYQVIDRDIFKDRWLQNSVPPTAGVVADRLTGLRLVNRPVMFLSHPNHRPFSALLPEVEYVVVDALFDFVMADEQQVYEGGVASEHGVIVFLLQEPGWHLLKAQDGLLLFGKQPAGLTWSVETDLQDTPPTLLANFAGQIGLVDFQVEPLGENRFRLHYTWLVLETMGGERPLLAISQPVGLNHTRFIHFPLLTLPATWEKNSLIQESFEVVLPANTEAGVYPLQVSWHDTTHLHAAQTDERSQLGQTFLVGELRVK